MKNTNRILAPLALAAALSLPIWTNGCGPTPLDRFCCTDFKVGADLSTVDFGVDASIKGQFAAFAQASADLSAVATGALDDVAGACKGIAQAGGANAEQDGAAPTEPSERVKFWCDLATARIEGAFSAQGGASAALKINVVPGECKASFKAEANCQAKCDVSGSCNAEATPPKCTGGKLEVSCDGACTAEAGASVSCQGSCSAHCEGTCTAQGGVECSGKCEGECTAGGTAGGSGAQADGSCKGICKGTCSVTPPGVTCTGSCNGGCEGTCQGSATAKVKCDGKCEGKAEPLSCKGGKLEASCDVDASCSGNCEASAEAKAECTPPQVDITFNAGVAGSVEAEAVLDALRLNLPSILLVAETRGKAFADLVGQVSESGALTLQGGLAGKVNVKGLACLGAILPVVAEAAKNAKATVSASASVAGSVGL